METARSFCQDKLMPGIVEANRHERFDRSIMNQFGELGLLEATLPEQYGGSRFELRKLRSYCK